MIAPLRNPTYVKLFAAQVVALLGTGLTTVALALLAWEIGGERAGTVLGTALALKTVAYVTIAPVVGGLAAALPRKPLLVGLDLVRAAMVGCPLAQASATPTPSSSTAGTASGRRMFVDDPMTEIFAGLAEVQARMQPHPDVWSPRMSRHSRGGDRAYRRIDDPARSVLSADPLLTMCFNRAGIETAPRPDLGAVSVTLS